VQELKVVAKIGLKLITGVEDNGNVKINLFMKAL
jgi:hypothetical protein